MLRIGRIIPNLALAAALALTAPCLAQQQLDPQEQAAQRAFQQLQLALDAEREALIALIGEYEKQKKAATDAQVVAEAQKATLIEWLQMAQKP